MKKHTGWLTAHYSTEKNHGSESPEDEVHRGEANIGEENQHEIKSPGSTQRGAFMRSNTLQKAATPEVWWTAVQWWKSNKHGDSGNMLQIALYFYFRVLVKTTMLICFRRFELNAYTYHQPNLAAVLWKCDQAMPGRWPREGKKSQHVH